VTYVILKYTHVAAVVASFTLFFVRGLWMMTAPEKLAVRWVRVVPHVIDTVLLVSAIALAAITAQYPFVQPWLTAKVLALLLYIILGTVAIRRGRTWRVRVVAWILALTVFGYMIAVARARVPFPWGI
jgi:uncharacterized membrane protein SirB2